ncbi:MAG: delta-lactam-biosynthetic de-N-acetylase [Thermosediminibacteraceae bacterium]|nr:delta-lactam-biosynthetic de-N-acetylase [Thermosediminibacteraceae bacterium]
MIVVFVAALVSISSHFPGLLSYLDGTDSERNETSESIKENTPSQPAEENSSSQENISIPNSDPNTETNTNNEINIEPNETESQNNFTQAEEVNIETLKTEKFGWWYKPNSQHKTPEIPTEVAKMLDKFDAIYVGDTSRKVVYLTFDEGYENGYTSSILDTLKENNVTASFFVTGSYIDKNPELVRRMVEEGHYVCSHTSTHPSLPDLSDAQLEKEIKDLEEKFRSVTGREIERYLRPPNGEYSEKSLYLTQKLGYVSVFWSLAYKDWDVNDQKGADYAYNFVTKNVHPGAVILLHAVSKSNAEALDRIIKGLINEGYTFERLPKI